MGIRSILSKPLAAYMAAQQRKWSLNPSASQAKVFKQNIKAASQTVFGKDHNFESIKTYDDFKKNVPIRDYEELKPYVEKILQGEADVLWPGKPAYFAKTSGTTSGTKYIPITKDSIPNHIGSARDAILSYVAETGKSKFLDNKLIFLSGSPETYKTAGINTGRLSGIVNHHVPSYLRSNQMPSYETNCIEDWEQKLDAIIDETLDQPMSLISGIPPQVQMYFDRIQARTGKKIKDIFPEFELFIYGGVNFEPYRQKLFETIGKEVDSIELYPASEGFIAYQDSQKEKGLLLLLNSGIFFEFVPADEYFNENPTRLSIDNVELDKNYALIINNNAGLWGYSIGDTIKFVSKDPYRIVVSGRIKHFISAFGEHVIGEEVEKAMQYAVEQQPGTELVEFTVAPNVAPKSGLPLHEWYIEFANEPSDLEAFEKDLNLQLRKLNSYYDDLISGSILKNLEVKSLSRDAFRNYMKSQGKLGGQNKVPRLSNDRKLADALFTLSEIVKQYVEEIKKKHIAILGSTGSIGTQALEVIQANPDRFQVEVLTAQNNCDLLIEQAIAFKPNAVVIGNENHYDKVFDALDRLDIKVYAGENALSSVVQMDSIDLVLTALVGYAGLKPTIKAIESGKPIALANKETMVVAGELVTALAEQHGVNIYPVDSEHSAIFQCLVGEFHNPIEKIILTASGGPFRGKDTNFLKTVTKEQALKHPNWDMGAKITIDSASLMNKGLEVIEAKWLFNLKQEQIEVIVHPQSIIHSIVQFEDGSMKAQMGLPDMKLPIQFAMTYPERIKTDFPRFDFLNYPALTFEQADTKTFRNLALAFEALKQGGNMSCILNAANEVAVEKFLKDEISFLGMSDVVEACMQKVSFVKKPTYEDYVFTDEETRKIAFEHII